MLKLSKITCLQKWERTIGKNLSFRASEKSVFREWEMSRYTVLV